MCAHETDNVGGSADSSLSVGAYADLGARRKGARIFFGFFSPCAQSVYLVGSFNGWSETDPLKMGGNGVWMTDISCEEIEDGDAYKYKVYKDGKVTYHTDPYALETDGEPYFNSVYRELCDEEYDINVKNRAVGCCGQPLNIYEMRADGWLFDKNGEASDYSHLAKELLPYLLQMGYTHVSLSGISEKYFDSAESRALTAYFAPSSTQGGMDALRAFVKTMHNAGIGVLIDRSVNRPFAMEDADMAFHIRNALYWIDRYSVDGFTVDIDTAFDKELFEKLVQNVKRERNGAYIVAKSGKGKMAEVDVYVGNYTDRLGCFNRSPSTDGGLSISASAMACLLMEEGRMITSMGQEIGSSDASRFERGALERPQNARFQLFCSELNHIYLSHPELWQCTDCSKTLMSRDRRGMRIIKRCTCDGEAVLVCDLEGMGGEMRISDEGEWSILLDSASVLGEKEKASLQTARGVTYLKLPPYGSAMLKRVN